MEIERKFLVKELPRLWEVKNKEIEQYYIGFSPEVRARRSDKDYMLTFKSEGNLERHEVEIDVERSKFEELKKLAGDKFISKTRYYIPYDDYMCELDIYHNIKGLITVEVEFNSLESAKEFNPPDWFGEEITNICEFKNKNLAVNGLPNKLKCPSCRGKREFYDRHSMSHHVCSTCKGEGTIDIKNINIGNYNKHIKI